MAPHLLDAFLKIPSNAWHEALEPPRILVNTPTLLWLLGLITYKFIVVVDLLLSGCYFQD